MARNYLDDLDEIIDEIEAINIGNVQAGAVKRFRFDFSIEENEEIEKLATEKFVKKGTIVKMAVRKKIQELKNGKDA